MKKNLLNFLLLLTFPILSFAQNGGTAINNTSGYISVADNDGGELDKHDQHTIEMWIKAETVMEDQKLFNKIADDFTSGYILGIRNSSLVYETFNENGTKSELVAGELKANRWIHIAATYKIDGLMQLYINGELVGEKAVNNGDNSFLEDVPLIIGTAGWDLGVLTFRGEIEEVRFWNTALTSTTLKDWMHRVVSDQHPAQENLNLYHKYDNSSGTTITDHSPNGNNPGMMFSSIDWVPSSTPFKANQYFASTGPAIGGVYPGNENYTLEDLTIIGIDMADNQSTVFESNTANTPICGHTVPAEIDAVSCLFWAMVHQGNPTLSFDFDLSSYVLVDVKRVFLLESTDVADFTNGKIIEGIWSGNNFEVSSHVVSNSGENVFYALGFEYLTASTKDRLDHSTTFTLSPNPSDGPIQLNIESSDLTDFQLQVMDYSGKIILEKNLADSPASFSESFDWSHFPKGMYLIRLSSAKGIRTQKLVLR